MIGGPYLKIKLTGIEEVIKNLKAVHSNMGVACERGIKKAGLLLLRESMLEVPVDKEILKGSARSRKISGAGFSTVVEVGYRTKYAVYVHEDLSLAHGKEYNIKYAKEIAAGTRHARGEGQKAKFLEDPMNRKRLEMFKVIENEVKKGVKK